MIRLAALVSTAERILIVLLSVAALALASFSIATRYLVPELSLGWVFEVIIFALIWATFLASAHLVSHGGHINVESFLALFPRPLRTALMLFGWLFCLAVTLFLLASGIKVAWDAFHWGERTMSTLRLPLWLYYLSLPIGALLSAFHLSCHGIRLVASGVADERLNSQTLR